MSKINHKKNTTHAKQHKVSTNKETRIVFGKVSPEYQEYLMMLYPEYCAEIIRSDEGWDCTHCSESTFPIASNLFGVEVRQFGDNALDILSDFSLCLRDKYAAREFRFIGDSLIVFAVDAPEKEVYLIWHTIMQVYHMEVFEDESTTC